MIFSGAAFHYVTAHSVYANLCAECQQALVLRSNIRIWSNYVSGKKSNQGSGAIPESEG